MAGYLATNDPGNYYNDDLTKSFDFSGYFAHQKQRQEALKNQQLNRDIALEDLFMSQKENPLKLRKQELDNQGLEALLPGKQAASEQAVRDNQVRQGVPLDVEQKAALQKAMREMSDDEWKQTVNGINQLATHPSKHMRKAGAMLQQYLPDMVKLRETLSSKEEIEALKRDARAEADRVKAAAAVQRKSDVKPLEDTIASDIGKHKNARDKMAAVKSWIGRLGQDHPLTTQLLRMESELLPLVNADQEARTAGKQIIENGKLVAPPGIKLAPRAETQSRPDRQTKPDPLGIR